MEFCVTTSQRMESMSDNSAARAALLENPLNILPRKLVKNVDLKSLKPFPGNPKDHDRGAILESMQANGVVDMIYVQDWPKTPKYVISGHGRRDTLLAAGIKRDDCIFVQISPEAAQRYVIAANRAAERGGWHDDLLVDALKELAESNQLMGTGYDGDDLDDLMAALTPMSLHELEQKHGAGGEDSTWPIYRLRMPHKLYEELTRAIADEEQEHDHEALSIILRNARKFKAQLAKQERASERYSTNGSSKKKK